VSAELPRLGLAHIPKFRVERHGFLEVPVVFHGRAVVLAQQNSKKKQRFGCAAPIGWFMTLHASVVPIASKETWTGA
jgi:hypothetical protein